MYDLVTNLRTWRERGATVEVADFYREGRYVGSAWRRLYRGRERGWTVRADGAGRVEYWSPEFVASY
jgi:hypothetical protein